MPVTRSTAIKMEDTLKQLMEMMQNMETNMKTEIKKSQENLETKMMTREDMKTELKNNQEDMETKIMTSLKTELKNSQEDMKTELKKSQEDMKTELKKSQEDVKTELKDIKDNQTEMKTSQTKLEERFQANMSKLEESIKSRFHDFEETIEEEMIQMKTEMEKKVQVIVEDKFQVVEEHVASLRNEVSETEDKFEKKMKNLETKIVQLSTSGAIKADGSVASSSRIKLPTFDGKVSWGTYLRQFEAAAVANNWSDEEKATSLIMALRGEAVEVLRTIPEHRQQDYTALAAALEMRYGELHLQHVYQAQLKGRRQRYDETLQQYEADIAKMVSLAYPTAPTDFREQLAVSSFIDGLRDSEISQALRLARHKNIAEALAQALEIEAAKQASRNGQGRVRQINIRRQDKKTDDLIRCVQDLIGNIQSEREEGNSSTFRRRPIRCWNCGTEGHLRNRCPKIADPSQDQGNAN